MNMNINIILLLLILPVMGLGQNSYNIKYSKGLQNGYIILKNGNHVNGQFKVKGKLRNQNKIIFLQDGAEEVMTSNDIDGYVFNQTKFVDVGKGQFRQIIEEGCLNIYQHSYMSYSASISGGLPLIIPYRVTVTTKKYKEQEMGYLYTYSFRKDWSNMLSDNQEVYQKILSKQYKKRHYLQIAREYNSSCEY